MSFRKVTFAGGATAECAWVGCSAAGNVRAPWIVAILVLLNALLLRAIDPAGTDAPARRRLRQLSSGSSPATYNPAMPVRIVDIDEAALAEYGQWPWPRTIVARLVDKLTEKGAAVIAFDVVFAEPDRSSISRMVRDLVAYTDPETVQKLAAAVQDNDQVLADAMAHSRVVAGLRLRPQGVAARRRGACRHGLRRRRPRASSCRCSRAR